MPRASAPDSSAVFGRLASALERDWRSVARPNQLPPSDPWSIWLLMAGRGFGKTRTGAEWCRMQVEEGGARRVALVAPTAADARDVMVEGESGILAVSPAWNRPTYEPSKRRLTWPNGAIATLYSADEPERLRGPQHDAAWCDELGSWRYPEAWDMLMFGLRLGKNPRCVVTTTPKPIKLIRELLARNDVAVTRGSTYDNKDNLAPSFFSAIIRKYENTRLGRQELNAEILDDHPGAMWNRERLDELRVKDAPPLRRVVVAIDPAMTSGEDADETGLIVAGLGEDGHAYVLDDISAQGLQPLEWAQRAIRAYRLHRADRVVAEVNQGGDLVENTLRMTDPNVAYKAVHASRGKVIRAEPIAALYEQGKVHHVGSFPALEDQMCSFTADYERSKGNSPDRLDALVWALSELCVEASGWWNVVEFYRRELARENGQRPDAEQTTDKPAAELVRLKAPENLQCSHFFTITGRALMLPADRILEVTPEEADAMKDWVRVEPEPVAA